MRGVSFLLPELSYDTSAEETVFSNALLNYLSPFWLREAVVFALLFWQAFILTYLVIGQWLARYVSLFTGVFYILIVSLSPDLMPLTGSLVANSFLVMVLWSMLHTYQEKACANTIFNIGFWIGMSTLFEMSYIVFLPWALIAITYMRRPNFKESIMLLVGFVVPYIFVATYYFWIDQLGLFFQQHFIKNLVITGFSLPELDWRNAPVLFMAFLVLVCGLNYRFLLTKKGIPVQKKIEVIFQMLLFAILSLLIHPEFRIPDLVVLAVPLSILLGLLFIEMKNKTADSFFWLLLIVVFILQLRPFVF